MRGVRRHLRRRTVLTCAGLLVVLAVAFVAALVVGDYPLAVGDVLASLTGRGTRASDFIVYDLRLPRVLSGLLVGFALGMAGAVFQTMLRNPLASPDIIGITAGASAAAVTALLLLGLSGVAVAASAFGGALVTALAIYLLAWRQGVAGYPAGARRHRRRRRAALGHRFLMTRAQVNDAQVALVWLTGSLNGADAGALRPLAVLVVVVVPLTLWAGRTLSGLQLGDDTARALGVGVERSRLLLMLFAVALAAVATSVAGPVGFVAFVSGPIARRLTGAAGAGLVPAGLVGAAVVTLADFAGQHLLPIQLPVGVLTAAVGAPYLIYLLLRTNAASARKG